MKEGRCSIGSPFPKEKIKEALALTLTHTRRLSDFEEFMTSTFFCCSKRLPRRILCTSSNQMCVNPLIFDRKQRALSKCFMDMFYCSKTCFITCSSIGFTLRFISSSSTPMKRIFKVPSFPSNKATGNLILFS